MAFSMNNGGGFRSRSRGGASLSEINVTPFVDVVLVLLIIFMLTAHVMEFGLEVDVPKVRTVKESRQELPVITVTKDGLIMLNENAVNIHDLGSAVRQRFKNATGVYVRADKDVVWGVLAQIVAELGDAKLQLNMVSQPVDTSDKGRQ
jgi:biopolymer transport protein ExbD